MIKMENFFEKLSAYHFLNYLIPGALFLYLIGIFHVYEIKFDNAFVMLFGGYCVGMILSRIGSMVIEKILKKWRIVVFADYTDFVEAELKDTKVTTLSTENNLYRTFVAMFFVLLVLYGLNLIPCIKVFLHSTWAVIVACSLLIVLYVFAYRKQTSYVRKRVYEILGKDDKDQ